MIANENKRGSQPDSVRNRSARERVILQHQGLVISIAARFVGRGETLEDLIQVGNLGLVKALDRYDSSVGTRFSTYATPVIVGEIKRHLRDQVPAIKIPRGLQERYGSVWYVREVLVSELERSPTAGEIAARLGSAEEEVLEAIAAGDALNLQSIDSPGPRDSALPGLSLTEVVGAPDRRLETFECYHDLWTAVSQLIRREREVLTLRYFHNCSQKQTAQRMCVSQMQVSRLERFAPERLRETLISEPGIPPSQ